jgi:hypothetical protein
MKDHETQENAAPGGTSEADCSVFSRLNNATDFACIDAAARAWIEAGGDADGVTWSWHHIRDRVGELE